MFVASCHSVNCLLVFYFKWTQMALQQDMIFGVWAEAGALPHEPGATWTKALLLLLSLEVKLLMPGDGFKDTPNGPQMWGVRTEPCDLEHWLRSYCKVGQNWIKYCKWFNQGSVLKSNLGVYQGNEWLQTSARNHTGDWSEMKLKIEVVRDENRCSLWRCCGKTRVIRIQPSH